MAAYPLKPRRMKVKYCAMTGYPGLEKLRVYVSSVPLVSQSHSARYTSKIVEFKFQVFGKLIYITEDNPTETGIGKSVFVSGTILRSGNDGRYVLILLTRGTSKPNLTLGVANGQNIAPLAPSTWIGISRPVSSWYLSRRFDTSKTGS